MIDDVVVRQRAAVLELLARKDQALLVGRDAWRGIATREREREISNFRGRGERGRNYTTTTKSHRIYMLKYK